MMLTALFLIIILIFLVLLAIIKDVDSKFFLLMKAFCLISILGCLICFIVFDSNIELVESFNYQKASLEWFDSNTRNEYDFNWVIQEKQKLNDWLIKARESRQRFGDFSFYPPQVENLSPILW